MIDSDRIGALSGGEPGRDRARHVVLRRDQPDLRRPVPDRNRRRASARCSTRPCSSMSAATSCRCGRSRSPSADCSTAAGVRTASTRVWPSSTPAIRNWCTGTAWDRSTRSTATNVGGTASARSSTICAAAAWSSPTSRCARRSSACSTRELNYGRVPVEVAGFVDAGLVWSHDGPARVPRRRPAAGAERRRRRARQRLRPVRPRSRRVTPVRSRGRAVQWQIGIRQGF